MLQASGSVCASVDHLGETSEECQYTPKVQRGLTLCGMLAEMLFCLTSVFQIFLMHHK